MDDLVEAVGRRLPHEWIFWVGAGISASPPTALPVGDTLTEFSIDETCGPAVRARVRGIWAGARALCTAYDPDVRFFGLPRLESVLGAFADAERGAADPLRFLRGFTSFASAPPNRNHFLLAEMVRRGAAVVTTNFDLGVQRALEAGPMPAKIRVAESAGMFRSHRAEPCFGCGDLVHIHGVADDIGQLGATLARVKEGLGPEFRRWLEARLERGAVLVFVGYSASDAFDVTPYFTSRPERVWPRSSFVFVQHETGEVPAHVPGLACGFGLCEVGKADTTAFLEKLHEGAAPAVGGPRFDWPTVFRGRLRGFRRDTAAPLLTCALANALGINPDVLDPDAFARAAGRNPGYAPREYHGVLALAGRGRGRPELEARHHRLAGGRSQDRLGYHYARGNLLRARMLALSTEEILRTGRAAGPVDWKPYTSLSVHARLLLHPYLLLPRLRARGRRRLRALDRLAEAAGILAGRELADVTAVHQVATALRFRLLFACLRDGRLDRALEHRILSSYAEQSHLGGFVSGYRDFALSRALLLRHAAPAEVEPLAAEAERLLTASAGLARLIGDAAGEGRAHIARRLLARAVHAASRGAPASRTGSASPARSRGTTGP